MSKAIDELVKEVLTSVKEAKKFSLEQAPDLAKEVVAEAKAYNIFGGVIALGFFLLSFLLVPISTTRDPFWIIPLLVGLVVGGIVTFNLLSLIFAPKMFILNKLSQLIK